MARYTCPSCGAVYNGRKCRECFYEHFSEEIAHGNHTHKGEPLVIDAPVRRPIPRKDPFGCDRKRPKARRQRRQHPLVGLLVILFVINAFLPMLRDWGLELEAMEEAAMAEPMPENLTVLHQEGPITLYAQSEQLTDFDQGLRIWVKNELAKVDVYASPRYVTVNGFVMAYASLYAEASADSYGMGTLYLDQQELLELGITQVQEMTFVLEVVDEDYTVLFETEPITLSATGRPVEQATDLGGTVLVEENGIRLSSLGYKADSYSPKYENGCLRFYVENDTDSFLSMNSLETTVGGQATDLYLWADLPPHSRGVARMYLHALEELEWDQPSQLGELSTTVVFWDPEEESSSQQKYRFTMPLTQGVR